MLKNIEDIEEVTGVYVVLGQLIILTKDSVYRSVLKEKDGEVFIDIPEYEKIKEI